MRIPVYILFIFCLINGLSGQDHSINVMTFNVRYPNPGDSLNYWDHRRPHVASIVRFHEIDILGVQEAHRRQLDEMIIDMPEYAWFGVCRTDGKKQPDPDGEFSAILYRRDRFERLDGNTFWLSETPDSIGSVGWDAALTRTVTWAKFKDWLTGNIFFHFNTHFDHMGEQARINSSKLLLKQIEVIAGNSPVIVTGDFNCTEKDLPYFLLTDSTDPYHLSDAFTLSELPHHGPMATFAGNFQISGMSENRIDFIFIRNNIEVYRHAILSDSWNGHFASDHLPVIAEVDLK